MKQKIKTFAIVIATLIGLFGVSFTVLSITRLSRHVYQVYHDRIELNYYGAKDNLVNAVDAFIKSSAPSSCLNGLVVVNECENASIDVVFVLSQGLKESHFGTAGVAAKTNSVFNVMAYDGRSATDMIKKGDAFKHPDMSVAPYIKLLKTNYLVNGKTEMDLLDKYVDKNGKRYASAPSYEDSLREIYFNIKDTTEISNLYKEFLKYKMLSGK